MANEMDQLREWIRVAEDARATSSNVQTFDALIQHQRQRLENLEKDGSKQASAPIPEAAPIRTTARPQASASKGKAISSVSRKEIIDFSSHCVYVRSVYLFALRLFKNSSCEEQNSMRAVAPRFFEDLPQVFAEFVVVAACRITDPAKDARGNENMSLEPYGPRLAARCSHRPPNHITG